MPNTDPVDAPINEDSHDTIQPGGLTLTSSPLDFFLQVT